MYLPTNYDDLLNLLLQCYDRTNDYIFTDRLTWKGFYKLYRNYVNEKAYPFNNKIFIPWTFSTIETSIPRFVAGLLYKRPYLDVLPEHFMTPRDSCENASWLLNKKWMVDQETWMSQLMMIKEHLMCGTSMGKLMWSKRYRQVMECRSVDLSGSRLYTHKEKVKRCVENRPRLIHRDIYDVTPDLLNGHNPDFVFDTVIKGMDEIRYGAVEYDKAALDELEEDGDYKDPRWDDWRLIRLSDIEHSYPDFIYTFNHPRQLIEVTVREQTRDGEIIHVITIGNRKHILRHITIPTWPWVVMRNHPLPHEFLGISEIEAVESLQHGYNNHINGLMDSQLYALYKMFLIGDAADINMDDFFITPGGVIQAADISQIKDLQFSGPSGEAYNFSQFFPQNIQIATGIHDYLMGNSPQRREAASSIMSLQQASEARMDTQIKLCERNGIVPIAQGMLDLAQFELDEPDYVYNPNKDEWYQIALEEIQGMMRVEVAASAMGMSTIDRQQLIEFTQDMAQLLGPSTPVEARLELLAAITTTFHEESLDKAVDSVRKIIAQQAQQQAVQGAAGQAPQGTPPGAPGPSQANGKSSLAGLASTLSAVQGGANNGAPQGMQG